MQNSLITQLILPLALFIIMFGMGMSLVTDDFRRVLKQPRSMFIGVSLQILWLPLLGFLVVLFFRLPAELAIGLLILTFAPGGATSNMIAFLSRADTALSISLTAVVSLITPLTLPLMTMLTIQWQAGHGEWIDFPVAQTMLKLTFITILPVALGMTLRRHHPNLCSKAKKPVKILSILFLVLVVAGITKANWNRLPELITIVGPAVITLVLVAMGSGYLIATKSGMQSPQALSIAIEVGIQNAGTALLVTGTILQNPTMSASALIYGILMQIPALLLIAYRNLGRQTAHAY